MTEDDSTTLIATALECARRGWAVIPLHSPRDGKCSCGKPDCGSHGKHPRNSHGVAEATTSEAVIRRWWKRWPDSNIGVATGAASGLVALDIDTAKGGEESLAEFIANSEEGQLPNTVESQTGGGGRHILFAHPGDGITIRNITNLGGLVGLDVRGDGGYVVAPQSLHASGYRYHWEVSSHPDDVPLAPLPQWLLRLVEKRQKPAGTATTSTRQGTTERHPYAQKALAEELTRLARSKEGSRNDQLNKSAFALGQLVGAGLLTREEVRDRLAATARGIGLEESEIEATIKSGLDSGIGQPRAVTPTGAPSKRRRLGSKLPPALADLAERESPDCPDRDLRRGITGMLRWDRREAPVPLKDAGRESAGGLLLAWLRGHGAFVESRVEGRLLYFYKPDKHLFDLESNDWRAWLYALTGANPAGTDYSYLDTDCKTAAQFAKEKTVVRVSAWHEDSQTLRVSGFDGTVYVLNGETVRKENNGDSLLFDDASWCRPYTPNLEGADGTALRWATLDVPPWDGDHEMHALGYRAWILSTFFIELCPTRPLLVLFGEKGSGKSMTVRIFMQLLVGPEAQLSGVPDKQDGFTAAASANHILVLDNLDQFTPWLRDKLARLSTGAIDQFRRLYTSNEVGTVRYRAWVALTARTPDTLRRDDLADRLLLLPTCFVPEEKRRPERQFLGETKARRNDWWGDVLHLDTGALDRLTNNNAVDIGPAWSPDGTCIAFSSNRDGDQEIYVMKGDGSGPSQLTHNPVDDVNPSWSPDGRYMCFTTDQLGNSEIHVVSADGRLLIPLTDHPATDFGACWAR